MLFSKLHAVLVIGTCFSLFACAGGGESGTGQDDSSSTPDPIVASGQITGFGSVFVNGVEFQTTNSSVSLDGVSAAESQLSVGMFVNVRGSKNVDGLNGNASLIEFDDELEGVVNNVNIDVDGTGTLDVMGQSVHIMADTILQGVASADLIVNNNVIEVSGYSNGLGSIYATWLNIKAPTYSGTESLELKGVASMANTTNKTFFIGSQEINYADSSVELIDLPNNLVQDNYYVDIKSEVGFSGAVLLASKIKLINIDKKEVTGTSGVSAELEGVITTIFTTDRFGVNGQTVIASDSVLTTAMLLTTTGVKVEVEGTYNSDGLLVAADIEIFQASNLEVAAYLQSVDLSNSSDPIVTVLGIAFHVLPSTILKDETDSVNGSPDQYFNLSSLDKLTGTQQRLEIQAYKDPIRNHFVVTRLVRKNYEQGQSEELDGRVSTASTDSGNTIEISGIVIDTSVNPSFSASLSVDDHVEIILGINGELIATSIN
ncbi:MAG: DUF5666 domain-containing protein [Gammaproteobacteria bacterium]|nr:DUF5666 domain-containing protein [Gammaproteobacteria bacterium]MDH5728074.1 DUF5666 domain-containing protein [Gammaproteobacteria bacterium]